MYLRFCRFLGIFVVQGAAYPPAFAAHGQTPKHNIPGVSGSYNQAVKQGQTPKHRKTTCIVSNHSRIKCSCVKSRHRWN